MEQENASSEQPSRKPGAGWKPGAGCLVATLFGFVFAVGVVMLVAIVKDEQGEIPPGGTDTSIDAPSPRADPPGRSPGGPGAAGSAFPRESVRQIPEPGRRAAWEALFRASRRATAEANQTYPAFAPGGPGGTEDDRRQYADLRSRLEKAYRAEAMAAHQLKPGQASDIEAEWAEKKWPAPPDTRPTAPDTRPTAPGTQSATP